MDAMGTLMLVCAVAASLALGVLVAYGICQAMFRLFRLHAVAEAKSRHLIEPGRQANTGHSQVAVRG